MIGKWVLDFMTRLEHRTKVLPSLICCPNMEGDECIFKGFIFLANLNATNVALITECTHNRLF